MASPALVLPPTPRPAGGEAAGRGIPPDLRRLARLARNHRHDAGLQQEYGLALLQAGQVEEALPYLEAARALEPTEAAHHINLSAAHHRLLHWEQAYHHAEQAHRLDLSNPLATNNLAALHLFWGEIPEAVAWYQRTLQRDPAYWVIWCNWLFALDFLHISSEDALRARALFNEQIQVPLKAQWPRHRNDPDPERRLRIGFTGGDFRMHSASFMFGPIYEHLDRERFQVVSYADLSTQDSATDWFQSVSNGWRDITGLTDEQIAQIVYRDQVDVLIDLGAFTDKSHLMVHMLKPAPLSITAWGHLTGTGLDCMDGILVDEVMLPRDRAWEVTEAPCYVPFALGFTPPKEPVEIRARTAEAPLTFGYLGRIQKIAEPTVALWAELLHANPGSRLLLKDGTFRQARTAERMLGAFAAHGIGADRIELRYESPRPEHLATYNEVDVALDPVWSQSGGATPLEALYMGTPSVALCDTSARMVSRIAASSLHAAGRPEWTARNAEEYVAVASAIGGLGGPELREAFLRSRACDNVARTRAFEDAVRELWRSWCRKQVA